MALSERDIISRYFAPLADLRGAHRLRDDCAELTPGPGQAFVFKTDPVREGVHFFAADDPADIAWKALGVNVSDLAAKAARPVGYLLAVSFPEVPDEDWLAAFSDGLGEAQAAFGLSLLGGDTDRAGGPLSFAVTVIGELPAGRMITRGGAKPGDLVYVSGTLGEAAVGLSARADEISKHSARADEISQSSARAEEGGLSLGAAVRNLSAEQRAAARARYLRPTPRLGLKAALRRYATAAMDLSDGLALDADRMQAASHACGSSVAIEIDLGLVPVAPVVQALGIDRKEQLRLALTHGDDYEILATVPPELGTQFEELAAAGDVWVTRIGQCRPGQGLSFQGEPAFASEIRGRGHQHF